MRNSYFTINDKEFQTFMSPAGQKDLSLYYEIRIELGCR